MLIEKEKYGEVTQIKATPDARFVFLGIGSASSIGVFTFDLASFQLTLNKWLTADFKTFEMDDYCTKIVFLN